MTKCLRLNDADGTERANGSKTARILTIILTFFLVANIAMHALEIARLAANHDGIGLLPVCFVPLVFVLISLYTTRPRWSPSNPANSQNAAWAVGVALWALWMVITVGVKLWSLSAVEGVVGARAYNGPDSKYPESDKVVSASCPRGGSVLSRQIDNIVILCVYAVILGLHTALQVVRRKAQRHVEAQRL